MMHLIVLHKLIKSVLKNDYFIGSDECLNKCLKIYESTARFQQAGKLKKQQAEEYETSFNNEEAINAYRAAADYFSMETANTKSLEQQCLLKIADLSCINNSPDAFNQAKTVSLIV